MKVVTYTLEDAGSNYIEHPVPEIFVEPKSEFLKYMWNHPNVNEIQVKFDDKSIYVVRRVK